MTETEFLRSERDAMNRHMDKHANEDFLLPVGAVSYSREYRCDCGFRCSDASVIYAHTKEPHATR